MGAIRKLTLALLWIVLGLLGACSPAPVNSPHPKGGEHENVLYTAFSQRSPKFLDPASSYSTDETPFTYSIYEPLYGYAYLARPYQLEPQAAAAITDPVYFDEAGQRLPNDTPGENVAYSVYDIPLKPGRLFQPHPVFAQDDSGGPAYWPISEAELAGKFSITDFPLTGT
ncbi:peptide ABC transporter substrate-binding protein, partial [Photobacterium phosphoreum]|nr:peptide ABC transporter substrate-binding protein [Photobacterium phosphoreum]